MVMIHDFLNMFLSEFFSFFKGININKTAQTFKVLKVLKVLKNFLCSFNREATMLFLVFNKLIAWWSKYLFEKTYQYFLHYWEKTPMLI